MTSRPGGVDHLGQAAQFAFDRLGLAHQRFEDAILGTLLVNEVVAEHFRVGLQLAVDAAVALLHAAGIPRHVEMEQVPAVGLQVEALAGGIGGDENAHRMLAPDRH